MDKTMADKLMYFPNDNTQITPSVDLNQLLKRLNTQLNKPTNQNSPKSPKLLSQRIRKRNLKTLGTSVPSLSLIPFYTQKILKTQFYIEKKGTEYKI